jgi:sulfide:quinone oxidoreductase
MRPRARRRASSSATARANERARRRYRFIPVDRATLPTSVEGIYAIGDVTTIPIAGGKLLPKAAAFASAQAEVVSGRIADELADRSLCLAFDGKSACFLDLGDGAAYAAGDFYAEGAVNVVPRQPGRHWHLAKVASEQCWLRSWPAPI